MFEKLPLILATRLAAGLIAVVSAASAQANVIVTFNTATATDVNYTITGDYTDLLSGFTATQGPWTILLDSPVPAPLPGSGDPWSLRLILEYAGLTGNRTDYYGGTPGVIISTFDAFQMSGAFAIAAGCFGCGQSASLDLSNRTSWIVGGFATIDPSLVPEPSSYTLLAIGLAGLAVTRRRKLI